MSKNTSRHSYLPPNWTTAALGELGTWHGGGTPSKANLSYWTGDIPWVSPKDMKTDVITQSEDHITQEALEQSSTRLIPRGSVLLVTRSGILEHTLPVALTGLPVALNQDLKALVPHAGVDSRYVAFALRNYAELVLQSCRKAGTTVASIEFERIKEFEIALPPTDEQQRIVSKLESLLARSRRAKDALDAIPDLLEKLRQSVLAAAFRGDLTSDWRAQHPDVEPASKLLERIRAERRRRWEEAEVEKFQAKSKPPRDDSWKAKYQEPEFIDTSGLPELPPTWCWTSLGSLLQQIEAGHSPKALGRPAMPHEPGVLKVSAVSWGEFLPEENKALPSGQSLDASVVVRANDLLISRANTPELVGAVVIARESYPNLMLSDKTLRLVPLGTDISKEYLLYSLRTHWVRALFATDATGTSDSMRNLSQEKIRSAPIALAPIDEQQEIERQLSFVMAAHQSILGQQKSTIGRLGELEQSILSKACRGELVPQDPADEPASVLLERIREIQAQESTRPTIRRTQSRPIKPSPTLTPVPNRNEISQNHLALIVERNGGRMSALDLYKASGLAIDDFYAQLRKECGDQKSLRDVNTPRGSRDVYIEVSR